MASIRKLRPLRGNSNQTAAYTGDSGELTVNTSTRSVVVHDGITPGGYDFKRSLAAQNSAEVIGGVPVFELVEGSAWDGGAIEDTNITQVFDGGLIG